MIQIIKKLLKLAGKDAYRIKLGFIFSFLGFVFQSFPLISVFYILKEIDRVGHNGENIESSVIQLCLALLVIGVLGNTVFRYLLSRFQSGTGYEIFAEQRLEIGNLLKRVPMGYFSENNLGKITSAITTDMTFVETYAMHLLDKVVNGYIEATLFSIIMLIFDWRIGLVFLATIVIASFVYNYLQKRSKELAPQRQAAQAGLVTAVLEYIQGMAVVKAFHMTESSSKRIHNAFERSRIANFQMEKTLIPIVAVYDFIFKIASSLILFLAPYFALHGSMSVPVMLMLLIASFKIFSSIESMGGVTVMVRMMDASLDRVDSIKDVQIIDGSGKNIKLKSYDIEFKNVSFSYGNREVIHNVSFTIPQNTVTAVVGPSGGGKSTLCNLIARFWDTSKGDIFVGGVNIKEMTCDSLLQNMSMVFQKVYLFNDTVLNNIRFGKPDATYEQVVEAAKRACCHNFISDLENGYDTVIGEGGSTLSGGEKQRISIARAILKDASIVILDEATASIDPENEREIQQAIEELTQGKTRIVIAHRLATIQNADQILVVDSGRIVQSGTHIDLVQQNGIYRKFWNIRQKSTKWTL